MEDLFTYSKSEEWSNGHVGGTNETMSSLVQQQRRRYTRLDTTTLSPQSVPEFWSESLTVNHSLFDSSPCSVSSITHSSPDRTGPAPTTLSYMASGNIQGEPMRKSPNHRAPDLHKLTRGSAQGDEPCSKFGATTTSSNPPPPVDTHQQQADIWKATAEMRPKHDAGGWRAQCAIREAVQRGDGEGLLRLHRQRPVAIWQEGEIVYPPPPSETAASHLSEQGASLQSHMDRLSTFSQHRTEQPDKVASKDPVFSALVIPSGGIDLDGRPNLWTRERLDVASELEAAGHFLICLSRATPHKPVVIDDNSHPLDEAHCMSRYLVEVKGLDPSRILCESWSRDTIGNAFACKQLLCGPLGLTSLLVINSLFHLPRTRILFDWIFHLPGQVSYHVDYLGVSNKGLSDVQVDVRSRREERSIDLLIHDRIPQLRTMADVTNFVFRQHNQYASWRPPAAACQRSTPPPRAEGTVCCEVVRGECCEVVRGQCSEVVRGECSEVVCCQHSEVFATY
eukprot:GHVS01038424.1.p1 GENE.GHVS01038424.1~~GHVS01038424.1.p1  ORF type:complete len:508 (+),score=61.84 GHVS01038424.1:116-1639(+)